MFFHGTQFYDYAKDDCPACGSQAAIVWRPGGAFQQRTECICGRKTRWVACGHDATANTTDAEILEVE